MELILKISLLWLAFDILIIASVWYAATVLQPMFPGWWQASICDYAPESVDIPL